MDVEEETFQSLHVESLIDILIVQGYVVFLDIEFVALDSVLSHFH